MKTLNRKQFWILAAVALLLLAVFVLLPRNGIVPPEIERPVLKAEILTVGLEEIPILREATGIVSSRLESTLASKISGLVEEIRAREGGRVKTGQVLLVLDSRDLRAQLDRVEADLENAAIYLQRMKKLYAEESVAKQELDNSERAHKVAEAAKKSILADLTYTEIKAPFGGVITEKMIEVGELATPGRPLMRLVDDRRLQLEAMIAESDIRVLRLGDQVTVKLDALEGKMISGTLSQILPSADPSTHSVLVKAELETQPGLKSGMFGRMVFALGVKKTLLVPQSAVFVKAGLARVFAVNELNIIQSRLVKLGKSYDGRTEILSGLKPEERILVHADKGQDGALLSVTGENPL